MSFLKQKIVHHNAMYVFFKIQDECGTDLNELMLIYAFCPQISSFVCVLRINMRK